MLTLKFILAYLLFSVWSNEKQSVLVSNHHDQSVTFLWSCDTTANTFRQDYLEGEK